MALGNKLSHELEDVINSINTNSNDVYNPNSSPKSILKGEMDRDKVSYYDTVQNGSKQENTNNFKGTQYNQNYQKTNQSDAVANDNSRPDSANSFKKKVNLSDYNKQIEEGKDLRKAPDETIVFTPEQNHSRITRQNNQSYQSNQDNQETQSYNYNQVYQYNQPYRYTQIYENEKKDFGYNPAYQYSQAQSNTASQPNLVVQSTTQTGKIASPKQSKQSRARGGRRRGR
ncbi:MAG: hypothetical protein J6Y86_10740 [Pseudobutyrivibrio sp.]|nr:hypothetical protein [Pseudobutyrivibrio sp.]